MVDLRGTRVLALLTRAPSSGGKSRLFAGLGREPDARLLEALLLDTIEGAATPGVPLVIAVTPASGADEIHRLLQTHDVAATVAEVVPQPEGDLGQRMQSTIAALLARGASAVAVIGSDLPHLTSQRVAAAFEELHRDPDALVLGPAGDGGYYLIAATRVPDVFAGVEWGSAGVLEQTRRAALAQGMGVRLLPPLDDVDTAADLRRVARSGSAPRTAAWYGDVLL